jgi:integrase
MIKRYSLNYYGIGKGNRNNMFTLYLRYHYTENGKKHSVNFNTDYQLTRNQIELIKENKLTGQIKTDLDKKKARIIQVVETLNLRDNSYPNSQTLTEYYNKTEKLLSIDFYRNKYLRNLTVKSSSKHIYANNVDLFIHHYKLNPVPLANIVTKKFFDDYIIAIEAKERSFHKKISNYTKINRVEGALRFTDFLAEEIGKPKLKYVYKPQRESTKLHLTVEELYKLITLNVNELKVSDTCKQNLYNAQQLIILNSAIGLRINELLNIRSNNIIKKGDYYVLKFIDFKRKKERLVIVKDIEPIQVIDRLLNSSEFPFRLFSSHDNFNKYLKKIAEYAELTDEVSLFRVYKNEPEYINIPKYKAISSHCLRRFAINRNLRLYGAVVAKQFSGHRDFSMIDKHYSSDLNEEELLDLLNREKKTNLR